MKKITNLFAVATLLLLAATLAMINLFGDSLITILTGVVFCASFIVYQYITAKEEESL